MSSCKLFYISHTQDGSGDNIDLFVLASNADEAVRFWWDYYEMKEDNVVLPDQIFVLPDLADREPGPLFWHTEIKPDHDIPVATAIVTLGLGETVE